VGAANDMTYEKKHSTQRRSTVYEILALKYAGPFEGSGALLMWLRDWEVIAQRCYYIWVIRGENETIVVDAVETVRGTAIVGSDSAHLFRNFIEDWPSAIITNLVEWLKTYDRLRARVSSLELLFPGHDPLLTENFPKIADGITKLI